VDQVNSVFRGRVAAVTGLAPRGGGGTGRGRVAGSGRVV